MAKKLPVSPKKPGLVKGKIDPSTIGLLWFSFWPIHFKSFKSLYLLITSMLPTFSLLSGGQRAGLAKQSLAWSLPCRIFRFASLFTDVCRTLLVFAGSNDDQSGLWNCRGWEDVTCYKTKCRSRTSLLSNFGDLLKRKRFLFVFFDSEVRSTTARAKDTVAPLPDTMGISMHRSLKKTVKKIFKKEAENHWKHICVSFFKVH